MKISSSSLIIKDMQKNTKLRSLCTPVKNDSYQQDKQQHRAFLMDLYSPSVLEAQGLQAWVQADYTVRSWMGVEGDKR